MQSSASRALCNRLETKSIHPWLQNCTQGPRVRTVLIVDSDLGFVFWLGQALDVAGYEALPAKSAAEAKTLVRELKVTVDVLVANPNAPGVAALAEHLNRSQGHLSLIALVNNDNETFPEQPFPAVRKRRACRGDEVSRFEWVHLIQDLYPDPAMPPLPVRLV